MNNESAAVEAVAWDYCPELRIAVTNGKGGANMTLNGHGAPAGISLYHGDYVSELQSALDALRGEVESAALRGELSALENFLRMASEPVGQECCGQGRYECCGNPIPVFAQPNEVFQAMSDRHAEILASLAALTKESP